MEGSGKQKEKSFINGTFFGAGFAFFIMFIIFDFFRPSVTLVLLIGIFGLILLIAGLLFEFRRIPKIA